jgi:hypothetical protein
MEKMGLGRKIKKNGLKQIENNEKWEMNRNSVRYREKKEVKKTKFNNKNTKMESVFSEY